MTTESAASCVTGDWPINPWYPPEFFWPRQFTAAPTYTTAGGSPPCHWCSAGGTLIYHNGPCPRVKSVEYHKNGTIKKVEFNDP